MDKGDDEKAAEKKVKVRGWRGGGLACCGLRGLSANLTSSARLQQEQRCSAAQLRTRTQRLPSHPPTHPPPPPTLPGGVQGPGQVVEGGAGRGRGGGRQGLQAPLHHALRGGGQQGAGEGPRDVRRGLRVPGVGAGGSTERLGRSRRKAPGLRPGLRSCLPRPHPPAPARPPARSTAGAPPWSASHARRWVLGAWLSAWQAGRGALVAVALLLPLLPPLLLLLPPSLIALHPSPASPPPPPAAPSTDPGRRRPRQVHARPAQPGDQPAPPADPGAQGAGGCWVGGAWGGVDEVEGGQEWAGKGAAVHGFKSSGRRRPLGAGSAAAALLRGHRASARCIGARLLRAPTTLPAPPGPPCTAARG